VNPHSAVTGERRDLSLRPHTPFWSTDTALLIYIALATVVLHIIIGNRYGFQRDELATLEDSRHLAWGYPAYPPVTPFFGRLSLILFGTSLRGFRFFAGVAQAVTVVLTGLMARDMGARRYGQLVAAVAALPVVIGGGYEMQYVAFDALAWVLTTCFIVHLLATGNPRWFLAIGASIGFGMMSKYTIGFFVIAILGAALLTDARRYFKSKWLWIGIAIAVLIWLPNLLWQIQHHLVSLDFLQHIHARDVREGRATYFLPQQFQLMGIGFPLVFAGLYFCLFARDGRRFRMIGWTYVLTLALFTIAKGRWYYMGPAYPMLYAAGAVWGQNWLATLTDSVAGRIRRSVRTSFVVQAALVIAFWLPLAPLNTRWWSIVNNVQGDFREQIGWHELVQEVAKIRDSLPPEQQAHLGIIGTNYGEAGAINLYGPDYHLPTAISGINSFWYRGYGDPAPQTLIVVGLSQKYVDNHFDSCRLAGHTWNQYGIKNEETVDHPDIFVCGPPKAGWPDFWQHFRYYG